MNTTTCTAKNGTYCCERQAGHSGRHIGVFRSMGKRVRAYFTDNYSHVTFQDA